MPTPQQRPTPAKRRRWRALLRLAAALPTFNADRIFQAAADLLQKEPPKCLPTKKKSTPP